MLMLGVKMNNNIMDVGELREAYIKIITYFKNENYKEALRIYQIIYESSFTEYQDLLDRRKKILTDGKNQGLII
mgnify:CR=1 FL=1